MAVIVHAVNRHTIESDVSVGSVIERSRVAVDAGPPAARAVAHVALDVVLGIQAGATVLAAVVIAEALAAAAPAVDVLEVVAALLA
jgi:hypothetical protein